jgi:Ser/Thr protein kinase RdoA (MazF antagonist)
MLLPVVVLGQTRGELCARPLRAFAATDFLAKARIRRDFELEQSRAVVELRRAGRGRAAHDHAGQAGHSGEMSRVLQVTERTLFRDWRAARAMIHADLERLNVGGGVP